MVKSILSISLILLSLSCSKDKDDNVIKQGIIENRPKIEINTNTQKNLDFSDIVSLKLDTALHFSVAICENLQEQLNTIKEKGHYKGLSIAVGIPNNGFWRSTIGESGTEIPLTTETKIHALSMGKIFTSVLTLKLIEEGYLNINETINKWFPECPRANEITINHLLSHTSGIQTHEVLYEFVLNDKNNYSEEEMVEMAFQYKIPEVPNSFLSYSNTGYIMLGIIIREVTGKSLKENFNNYLINPLGLKNTVYCDKENLNMDNIRGYNGDEISDCKQWPLTYAEGPFISTPTDIIILYNYILSGQFLTSKSMDLMLSEMNIWKYQPDTYYGKGIYLIKGLNSDNYLGHSGGHASFRTCVFYNIEKKVFVSVFSNTNAFEIEPAMFNITEKIIELIE